MSQRGIAGVLGVDQATVQRDLRDANASPEPEEPAPLLDSTDAHDANASPHKPHLSQNTGNDEGMSQRGIARVLGVSHKTVDRDLSIVSNDTHNTLEASGGAGLVDDCVSNDTPMDAIAALAATTEIRKGVERAEAIAERNKAREEKSKVQPQAMPSGKFSLIYADPPWRYEHVKTESRAIENQYPTMSLDEIKAQFIPAGDDCVLFLWATSPKLAESMEVVSEWGFEYRTCAVWDKETVGMGYYFRQQHELLLIATKGSPGVPDEGDRVGSIFRSSAFRTKRMKHSEKPHEVYDLIDKMYPRYAREDLRIELFSRTKKDGWSNWGNDPNAA